LVNAETTVFPRTHVLDDFWFDLLLGQIQLEDRVLPSGQQSLHIELGPKFRDTGRKSPSGVKAPQVISTWMCDSGMFHIGGVEIENTEVPWENKGRQLYLTVQAAGYSPELIRVQRSDKPLRVVLQRSHTVRGHVSDESRKPLGGVSVTERRWRGQKNRLGLGTKSNADGSFVITDLPADDIEYDFSKEGYMHLEGYTMLR